MLDDYTVFETLNDFIKPLGVPVFCIFHLEFKNGVRHAVTFTAEERGNEVTEMKETMYADMS